MSKRSLSFTGSHCLHGRAPPGRFFAGIEPPLDAGGHHGKVRSRSESAKKSLVYSYGRSFNGFAARLSDEEAEKLSDVEGVVSVIPNRILKLHTTRSWDFVGFSKGKLGAPLEGNVVIGLLDSGIWPESDSFNDEGMSAPPAKWKGKCVGANFTCNKKFVAQVVLGNGQVLSGLSINNFDLNGTTYPLIWGGNAANFSAGASPAIAGFCSPGALNSYKVERKIVLCDAMVTGSQILIANGVGVIMSSSFYSVDFAFSFPLPAAVISNEDRVKVLNYIRATENPIATILVAQGWKDVMAASVVSFSSRGPNPITPDILKPDITAPGADILAAWSPLAPPSIDPKDTRRVNFNIISGTSMSCPHASAAAAYVKAGHPNWSPAAIKSALMTTATIMEPGKHVDLEFSYGSGQINPEHALNPGLVYDASEADYINFLCKQGYNTTTLRMITGSNSSVCKSTTPGRAWDLNYPTFALAVEDGQPIQGVFTRTVTNVGNSSSTYTVSMSTPYSVSITVEPPLLTFSKIGEMKTFTVKLFGPKIAQQPIMSGAITWKDGNGHEVRSPVVVYNILPGRKYGIPTSSMTAQKTVKFEGPSMHLKTGILGRN
ncbi:PROPROTEIN CONVERTASE SUBTILISIN/KEXIN [Salix purpurea]|uniref:PROPROTEIN CONVERTASE SUBTILISIN/KEXIN n=1 Tax=Salix purpurea TaxID=77065 RepID=A0A9Q0QFD7_SALPP|nr:PROPROTEIN CONVERTASE SUBTILISIN/KEXIN [Salix purpurea]